ncbi:uncharacterized protein LOC119726659 [Patiria miniata]|uniref:Uncharacterized protein n=1 Tax=Patiria miniata TaxID=46514 RepID=A0A913ZSH5_PATMI|nr:uncharacterized protein LOC119726659 [Patiria miniata]XP_038054355.1 uncharacterized protein LOC119726659 [Patiria miniata]
MTVQTFEPSSTGMGRQLLWRLAVLAAFLGLALTQTIPSTVKSSALTGSLPKSTQVTEPRSSNLNTTISTETNSSITTEVTNGTSNETTDHPITSALMTTSITTAITESTATTVSMATTQPVSTPEQRTAQPKTTLAPPKPRPTKHLSPVSKATAPGSDVVTPTGRSVPSGSTNNVALYLLLPLVVIAGIAMLVMIISYLRKRIRLDKLRHQLLPLYNFDPQEGEDWETELLTEPRPSSQTPLNPSKPKPTSTAIAEIPKLRFSPDTVDV